MRVLGTVRIAVVLVVVNIFFFICFSSCLVILMQLLVVLNRLGIGNRHLISLEELFGVTVRSVWLTYVSVSRCIDEEMCDDD